MPSVWLLNHYAGFPETVPATRTYELARGLVKLGWDVTVVASSFNHYTFVDDLPADSDRLHEVTSDGVRWVFIANTTPYVDNGGARLRNMLEYSFHATAWSRKQASPPNVVIGTTVHPFAAAAAARIARRLGARFCYEVTDLWPESLVDMGLTHRRSPMFRVMHAMERRAFKKADGVIGLLPGIADYARETYGFQLKRFVYIPNGMNVRPLDTSSVPTPPKGSVAYAGGYARAHGMKNIVQAAKVLQTERPGEFRFDLYGDGPERVPMENLAASTGTTNVTFHGFVTKKDLRDRLLVAEVCVCTGEVMPVHRYGVSTNKLFDYFDAMRPIVFAVDSGNNPVAEAGAGISVPAGDPVALAGAIAKISDSAPEERRRYGLNGRDFLEREHQFDRLAVRLAAFLSDVLSGQARSRHGPGPCAIDI